MIVYLSMTDYFDAVDSSLPFTRNRSQIIDGIKEFVQDEFGAETSQLNLNAWKLRFDVDAESQAEFEAVVSKVNTLVSDECPVECELEWEYIPTDSNNQKNGFYSGGRGDFDTSRVRGGSYPVEAFRVTVPRE